MAIERYGVEKSRLDGIELVAPQMGRGALEGLREEYSLASPNETLSNLIKPAPTAPGYNVS